MDFAIWAYPWDILDEGVEAVADRLDDLGIDEVCLATNYHSVQPFLPHNPERRTFFAQASSYFYPGEGYGRLRPVPNEAMEGTDWLAVLSDAIAETDIALSSWTIGCHNSRLGLANPDVTLTSPHGDSLAFGLCPSHPDVQEYLVALVSDLDERADLERIELESFDYFYGTGFGWHHEKYHARLGRLGEFLFGLCFCKYCCMNAADTGVDVKQARERAATTVDALAEGALAHDTTPRAWIDDHPEVAAYTDVRTDTLTELFSDLAAAVKTDLGYYVGLLSVEESWMHGADLAKLDDHVDYLTVIAYESSRADAVTQIRAARKSVSDTPLHAGVRPGHPDIYDGATVEAIVDGLVEEGVPRIVFYNYGMLPERNLGWVGEATQSYR